MMLDPLFDQLEDLLPEMSAFRRDLHMFPELSHHETETPKKVAAYLSELGLEVKTGVGGRGVVGILRGINPERR